MLRKNFFGSLPSNQNSGKYDYPDKGFVVSAESAHTSTNLPGFNYSTHFQHNHGLAPENYKASHVVDQSQKKYRVRRFWNMVLLKWHNACKKFL